MLLYPKKKFEKISTPKFGKDEESDFQSFINFCSHFTSNLNVPLLYKAYEFNIEANKNLQRKSGDPFYTHPLEVACFLVENVIYNDELIVSALLHDVLDKSDLISLKDIESEFGVAIAQIVDSVHRITNLERRQIADVEYFRRILIALTTDVRIIFIKIADRYIDMKTISYLSPESQRKFAEDTFQVYIPLAHRLGFYGIKSELEDMAFRVLDKENYNRIVRKLNMTKHERDETLKKIASPIIELLQNLPILKEKDIYFEIHGRVKHIYSIYIKTLLRGKPADELYDLVGLRVILDTEDESLCEKVMSAIKELYRSIPETYKDYIRNPKPNGYKSIHCAFVGPNEQKFEVQVRTFNMHLLAEKGIAAHYRYKSGFISMDSIFEEQQIDKWMQAIRTLLARKEEIPDTKLFEGFKYGVFLDEIYVFTPKGEIKVLPKNSIVLDFAYSIHTDVGHRCAGAKKNGITCSIFAPLENADRIEIIQGSNLEPELHWLDKVVTSKAKNAILKYFTQKAKELQKRGKVHFENLLRNFSLLDNKSRILNICLKILKFSNSKEFFTELGKSSQLGEIVEILMEYLKENNLKIDEDEIYSNPKFFKIAEFVKKSEFIDVRTHSVVMADCCLPARGDEIVAFLSGKNVLVHRVDCKRTKYLVVDLGLRKVKVDWKDIKQENFDIGLKFSTSSIESIHKLLANILSANDDVMLISWSKKETTPGYFFWKIYLNVKDNTFVNKFHKSIGELNLDIKIERIGKE